MRITNDIRDKIEKALIEHAFRERQNALQQRENEIALRVYRIRMPESFERQLDKADEARIPHNFDMSFFNRISGINARRPGMSDERLTFTHGHIWNSCSRPTIEIMDHDEVASDFEQFIQAREEYLMEVRKARAEIKATLKPIFTARKLEEVWPECMSIARPVLEECGMQPKPQPLVVQTEQLNAVLGLPVEEANDDEKEQVAA